MTDEIKRCSCGRVARFMICKVDKKTNIPGPSLPVCGTCDSEIGIKNLVACGVGRGEAEKINREVKKVKA